MFHLWIYYCLATTGCPAVNGINQFYNTDKGPVAYTLVYSSIQSCAADAINQLNIFNANNSPTYIGEFSYCTHGTAPKCDGNFPC